MENIEHVEPIFDLAVECERLFATQISSQNDHNEPNGAKILGDLNHRFAAWASFLGVFAESSVCLDRRLQHHPAIQDEVLRLLDTMERNLIYVFERDDGSPGRAQIEPPDARQSQQQSVRISISSLEGITGALKRLNEIGIAIRRSSVTSPIAKARNFAEKFDFTSFGEVAYLSLQTLYPNASESLLALLSRSMTETYALFLHRKSRQERLQAPRSQPRIPTPLDAIVEEPTVDTEVGSPMSTDMREPEPNRHLTSKMMRPPPPKPIRDLPQSEPTSVDSQEFRVKLSKLSSPSTKSKTMSILANHADYPRPTKGRLTCEWCFNPITADTLEGGNWKQHVNEDHKPYICISEKCSESLRRFATSTEWFRHMLTHGPKWHREVHAPLSWACPLCDDEATTFSKSDDLTVHFDHFHEDTFTGSQVDAIIRQSRFQCPRSNNTCPLCCFPVNDQRDLLPNQKGNSGREPPLKKPYHEESSEPEYKRRRTDIHQAQPEEDTRDNCQLKLEREPEKLLDQSSINVLSAEAMASHVAAHLQGVMLLTLRLISIDVGMDVTTDSHSVSGGTDHNSSWVSSSKGNLEQGIDNMDDFPLDVDDDNYPDDPSPLNDIVPDSEYTNWHYVPRLHGDYLGSSLYNEIHKPETRQSPSLADPSPPSPTFSEYIDMQTRDQLKKRIQAIEKIIDTESQFERDMLGLNEIYKGTSRACLDISAEDVNVLFSNSDRMAEFSSDFRHNLEKAARNIYVRPGQRNTKRTDDGQTSKECEATELKATELNDRSTSIGEVFAKSLPHLRDIYLQYLVNYDAANKRLRTLRRKQNVVVWLEECDKGASGLLQTVGLELLLARPVSRISEYPDLVAQLLSFTSGDHPDMDFLFFALSELNDFSAHIDFKRRRGTKAGQAIGQLRKKLDLRAGLSRAFGRSTAFTLRDDYNSIEYLGDDEFNALSQQVNENVMSLQIMVGDLQSYVTETRSWVTSLEMFASGFFEFVTGDQPVCTDLGGKWVLFTLCVEEIISESLVEHLALVETEVISPINTLLDLHGRPRALIDERNICFKTVDKRNYKPDKKAAEILVRLEVLDKMFEWDIPQLLSLSAKLVQACLSNFIQIQKAWHHLLQKKLGPLIFPLPDDISTIINDWSGAFMFPETRVLSLGICNGSILAELDGLASSSSTRAKE